MMKYGSYVESSVIANNNCSAMSSSGNSSSSAGHFHLEPSSVIKTAPPGHHRQQQQHQGLGQGFSPKHEPIDLAPLTQSSSNLQDLSKMHPSMDHYTYMPSASSISAADYSRVYDYMAGVAGYQIGATSSQVFNSNATAIAASSASNLIQQQQQQPLTEWRSPLEHPYITYQRTTSSSSSNGVPTNGGQIHYANASHPHAQAPPQQSHQPAIGALVIVDSLGQQQSQAHAHHLQEQRLYKALNGDIISPVDSGIGADLSMLEGQPPFALMASSLLQSQSQSLQLQHPQQQSSVIATHSQHSSSSVGLDSISAADIIQTVMEHRAASSGNSHHARETVDTPIHIPKIENALGFQYILEAPISTSVRREDDRMTYVNKGQFYTISLEYIPDASRPLKSPSGVRSLVMVVFRDNKAYEEEIRTWHTWHKRQHTYKQRILEVDSKNSMGIVGQVEEVAHNAIQFCWNPNEQPSAKISVAVQCLSTDFSTQKGVKGLPLHIQIDTYDEAEDSKTPFHRGFCQIKVFCDKGAERKLRDEDKRANRKKNTITVTGQNRKKSVGEFHDPCDRSQFYHMSDLERPAALFVPSDDYVDSRFLDSTSLASYETLSELEPLPPKRPKPSERIMIYVKEQDDDENIFTPLHLVPPTLSGLSAAICEKYHLADKNIAGFYKRCLKGGVTVAIDDDMLRHYTNQDTFLISIKARQNDPSLYTVTLVELSRHSDSHPQTSIIGTSHGGAIYHSSIQHHP